MLGEGSKIGGYDIRRLLGRGAMGEVYLADQVSLRRPVAIKRIADHLLDNHDAVARFEREAQCIARIQSQHVVMVHDFGRFSDEAGDEHYLLVMELVEGGTSLAAVAGTAVDWRLATCVIRQMAEGLEAAAEQGVIHRDIKPSNVMMTAKGLAKLCDFGLARAVDSTAMTMEGSLLGTPLYMSPESCRGDPVGPAGDIYSLGVTWYQLLCGRTPFVADNMMALLRMHLEVSPPPLAELAPAVPAQIASLVDQCLVKDPALRPDSAGTLARAIHALAGEGLLVPPLAGELVAGHIEASASPSTMATLVSADRNAASATAPTAVAGPQRSAEAPTLAQTVPSGPSSAASAPAPSPAPVTAGGAGGKGLMVALVAVLLAAIGGGLVWFKPWVETAPAADPASDAQDVGPDQSAAQPAPHDGETPQEPSSQGVDPVAGPTSVETDPDPITTAGPDPVEVAPVAPIAPADPVDQGPSQADVLADDVAAAIGVGDVERAVAALERLDDDHPRHAALSSSLGLLQRTQAARAAGDAQAQAVADALARSDLDAAAQTLAALDEEHPRYRELNQTLTELRQQQDALHAADDLADTIAKTLAAGDHDAAAQALARLSDDHPRYAALSEDLRRLQEEHAVIAAQVQTLEQALADDQLEEAVAALAAVPEDHPQRNHWSEQIDALRQGQAEADRRALEVAEALEAEDSARAAELLSGLPSSHARHAALTASLTALREAQEQADAQARQVAEALAAEDADRAVALLADLPDSHGRHAALAEQLQALQAGQAAAQREQLRGQLTQALAERRAEQARTLWQSLDEDPDFTNQVQALTRRQEAAWQLVEERWQAERYQEIKTLLPQLVAFPELAEPAQARQSELEAKVEAWNQALEQAQEQYDNGQWRAAAEALADLPVGDAAIGEGREAWRSLLADRIGRQVQETVQERLQAFVAEVQAGRYAEARAIAEDVRPLAEVAGRGEVVTNLLERLAALEEARSTPSQETP